MLDGVSRELADLSDRTIRTTIVLGKALVDETPGETGLKTRRELVGHHHQRKLPELEGAVRWEGNLDGMRDPGDPGDE